MDQNINKARVAIGEEAPTDYKITPSAFAGFLKDKAPELSLVMQHSAFTEKARRYEQHDNTAITAQATFKRCAHHATWAIGLASIASCVLAGISAADFDKSQALVKMSLFTLGLIATIGGGVAVYRLFQIKNEKLLESWMAARAKAETERLGYFSALARYLFKNHRNETYVHLLFVCMFKRYQLEVQRLYYHSRGSEHRSSIKITSKIGAIAALLLAFGSGMVGMVGAFIPDLLPIAALGTIGAAISTIASRREELNQDSRNSERYARTADILSEIAEKHDDVLTLVNEGKTPEVMVKYVDAVNDQLSLEHRQWTSDISEMSSALNALEESIKELHKE